MGQSGTPTKNVFATTTDDINGLLEGSAWDHVVNGQTVLTWSEPNSSADYNYPTTLTGVASVTPSEDTNIRAALDEWSAVANLVFNPITETTTTTHADLRFAQASGVPDQPSFFGGAGTWPDHKTLTALPGDTFFHSGATGAEAQLQNTQPGSWGDHVARHEIGHDLGLKHAFDSNSQLGATNAAGAVVPAAHDSWEYTIMTYHAYAGAPNYIVANRDAGSYAQSLMMDDIQAIQYLYGANFTTNSGDTRYSFDPNTGQMFIDGVGQGVPLGDKIFRTIWDGGGNDTYDFSNYTTNMTIDLRPGQWSTLSTTQLADLGQSGGGDLHHAAIGNVANAMLFQGDTRSLIENAIGGSGGDTITGNEANNTIYGGSGDDVIHGGDGNDILSGGFVSRSQATGPDGNDVIYGDAGNDVIKVLWGNDVVHGGADNDTLSFADVRTNLIVDLASGSTTYTEGGSFVDPSGNGGGAFAGLYTVTWDGIENLTGGSGSDTITGDGGANVLIGNAGNDIIHGGAGNDILYGGFGSRAESTGSDGNDVIYGDDGNDLIKVLFGNEEVHGGADNDTLSFADVHTNLVVDLAAGSTTYTEGGSFVDPSGLSAGGFAGLYKVTWDGIENLTGGSGSDTITGDDGANVLIDDDLTGNGGNNFINGGAGNDTIHGGGGEDTLIGGLGVDSVYGDGGDDTLVETYKYNPFAFDYLDGGAGTNTVDFSSYQDAVRIDLSTGQAWTSDGADLSSGTLRQVASLTSIENLIGGASNDELTGDDGNNRIDGGAGNDVIHGGGGNDTLVGGLGVDSIYGDGGDDTLVETYEYNPFAFDYLDGGEGNNTADFSSFQTPVAIDLNSSTPMVWSTDASGTWREFAKLVSIENLVGGAGNDSLVGDDGGNRIIGGAGNDTIVGGNGNDILSGGFASRAVATDFDGDDVINGEGGDDFITALWGNDTVHGGAGNDTLAFTDVAANLTLDLAAGHTTYIDGGSIRDDSGNVVGGFAGQYTVTWDGIENLTGGTGNDVLTGDSNDNTLDGGAGTNTAVFHGLRSEYTITSLADGELQVADLVAGRDGTDLLKNIQNLQFSDGEFAATDIATQAHIQDIDGIHVVYAEPSSAASGFRLALAGTGANAAFGSDGNDVLDASGTADYHTMLYGGAGNDTLIPGSAGSYTLQGGPGDDTAVFAGNQSDYTIDGSPAGWPSWATVTDNATGAVNWLQGVEHLQFADETIGTPGLPAGGDFTNVLFLDSSNPSASIGPGYDTVYVDDSHGPNPVHLNLAGTNVSFAYGGLGSDVFDATGVTSSVDLWGQWGNDVLIGGSGNDALVGDEWLPGGGNDWLDGGAGNDWLDGGNGDDTFVFRAGSGMDTVEDFDQSYPSPTSSTMVRSDDHDVIRFEDGLFANFDALVASGDMTQSGADVVIKYGASDQVTLKNVSLTNLTAQDFTFDAPAAPAVTYHVANDLNGDGISDVLFGKDNGSLAVWELNGNHIALNATVGSVPAGWHVDGIGDFGNDGKSDILLHSDSGQVAMWQMDGNHIASNTTVGSVSSAWHVSEVADFNGDGKADVLWQNTNGQVAMWQMDGDHIAANTTVGSVSSNWHAAGAADFNGDGKADVLWQNTNGQVAMWQMDGDHIASNTTVGSAPGWTVIGTGDYSHDGKADVLWQNASGNVAQWQMNGDHIDENLSVGSHSIDWHMV